MAGIYSVKQVNTYIKNMFDQDFALDRIQVKGEISNCKYHSSGHIYFTLKDESAALSCIMFAGKARELRFRLSNGQQVIGKGKVSVYERDGNYQLYVSSVKLAGEGDLYQKFLIQKQRLDEMGMFAEEYKQPIPRYTKKIGVVTASTGAAIQDIIHVAKRRNPYVELYLYPALVQGVGAAESIAKGIQVLDCAGMDCLIIGRGGGSIEDLWAFNEEIVARAIFDCETPVISAVGHEVDVTIADFAADLRAPTPSAAAELAVFDYGQFEAMLAEIKKRLELAAEKCIDRKRAEIEQNLLRLRLNHPKNRIQQKRVQLSNLQERLINGMEKNRKNYAHKLQLTAQRLSGLSPLNKLTGGYAYLSDEANVPVYSVKQVQTGDKLHLRLKDGKIDAAVTKREETQL